MVNPLRMPLLADPKLLAGAGRGDAAARRFKAALSTPAGVETPPAVATGIEPRDDDDRPDARHLGQDASRATEERPLPPGLRELWDELVMTLQAGQRLSSSHWRLRLRLDPQAFPDTALLLACTAGELALTVRTASAPVHTRLQAQWPELEARLQRHAHTADAVLQHVPLEELDS